MNALISLGELLPRFGVADWTWFNLVPGYESFNQSMASQFGDAVLSSEPVSSVLHIMLALTATAVVMLFAVRTRAHWASKDERAIPDTGFSIPNFVEMLMDATLGMAEQVFGDRKTARRYLPLLGSLALYILFSNVLGLLPGFAPPTDNWNITLAPAIVVFLIYNIEALKENGMHYVAHFMGPKFPIAGINFPWLFWLLIPIEIISHLARPLSLSLRLMGNMLGDHKVLAMFLGLTAFSVIFPLPVVALGLLVCIIQTLVFTLLAAVYIALGIAHEEEAH